MGINLLEDKLICGNYKTIILLSIFNNYNSINKAHVIIYTFFFSHSWRYSSPINTHQHSTVTFIRATLVIIYSCLYWLLSQLWIFFQLLGMVIRDWTSCSRNSWIHVEQVDSRECSLFVHVLKIELMILDISSSLKHRYHWTRFVLKSFNVQIFLSFHQ